MNAKAGLFQKNFLKPRQKAEEAAANLPALMIRAEKAVNSLMHGEHRQRKPGAGTQFWQFREYVPEDRPQDIDWRQSARGDQIFIRQKEWQTPQASLFWASDAPGMSFSSNSKLPTKGEAAKILTLALALLITRAGDHAGALGIPQTGRSDATIEHIGQALFDDIMNTELPLTHSRLPKNSLAILSGDFLSAVEEIKHCFDNISAQTRNGFVIQILDPAEIELPYQGRAIFEMPRDARRIHIGNVGDVRQTYQARIQDHLEQVRAACRQCGWGYLLHRTDTPLHDTLHLLWNAFSPQFPHEDRSA